jgi:hypothetical protein
VKEQGVQANSNPVFEDFGAIMVAYIQEWGLANIELRVPKSWYHSSQTINPDSLVEILFTTDSTVELVAKSGGERQCAYIISSNVLSVDFTIANFD